MKPDETFALFNLKILSSDLHLHPFTWTHAAVLWVFNRSFLSCYRSWTSPMQDEFGVSFSIMSAPKKIH